MKPNTLSGLMPLEPPPAPGVDPTGWIILGLLLLLGLLAASFFWSRPLRRRLRRLHQIEQQLGTVGRDGPTLAAEAEHLLRAFAPPGPLRAACPPASVDGDHWQALVDSLHALRFAPQAMDTLPLAERLAQVRRQLVIARGRA
jgi:hypothetical protein